MKTPIVISALLIFAGVMFTRFIHIELTKKEFIEYAISTWGTIGALISATFIVYGYIINLRSFAESQKAKIYIFVQNGEARFIETGELVHLTIIHYKNIGNVECEQLKIYVQLIGDHGITDLEKLNYGPFTMQVGDERHRDFPTLHFIKENVSIDAASNLFVYKLRVGCNMLILGKIIDRHQDYTWDNQIKRWNIA